jgi:hypothetical protein
LSKDLKFFFFVYFLPADEGVHPDDQYYQYGRAGVSLSTTSSMDGWVNPFPPPAVWTCRCIPFHHQQYGRAGVSLSTTSSMDRHGAFLSTTNSEDLQGVSLSNTSSMDVQGVSLSITSSMDVQGTTSSLDMQGVSLPISSSTGMDLQGLYLLYGLALGFYTANLSDLFPSCVQIFSSLIVFI